VILPGADKHAYASDKGPSGKRKRGAFVDDEIMAFNHMTEVVKDVAQAIRENKPIDVHPPLCVVVMEVEGFTKDVLLAAFGHLVDNKAQGNF
jgi:hypothetical protein